MENWKSGNYTGLKSVFFFFTCLCLFHATVQNINNTFPMRNFRQTFEVLGIVSMIFVRYSEIKGN